MGRDLDGRRGTVNKCRPDEAARLQAGTHYILAVEPTPQRVVFARGTATAVLRHNWYLQKRARPRCPQFATAPVPHGLAQETEKNAKLTQTYFRPWTLDATRATFSVPYAGHLRNETEKWESSLRQWLTQLPSAETKRYVGNFLSVHRVRPAAEADANSDDDDADEPFQLERVQLAEALRTLTPAGKNMSSKTVNDDRAHRVEAALAQADAWWNDTCRAPTPEVSEPSAQKRPWRQQDALEGRTSDPRPIAIRGMRGIRGPRRHLRPGTA